MNALKKTRIKTVMKYTWPFYLISGVLIVVLLNIIFGIVHKIPAYKSLTIFVSGEVTDSKALKNDLLEAYKDKDLKNISTISAKVSDNQYNTKLTIPGYNSADILILPLSKIENLDASYFALDLKDELITSFYSGYTFYSQKEVNYGIKINKEIVKSYMALPNEDCYMFLNGGSENLGEYSNKPNKEHDLALHLVKRWGM